MAGSWCLNSIPLILGKYSRERYGHYAIETIVRFWSLTAPSLSLAESTSVLFIPEAQPVGIVGRRRMNPGEIHTFASRVRQHCDSNGFSRKPGKGKRDRRFPAGTISPMCSRLETRWSGWSAVYRVKVIGSYS